MRTATFPWTFILGVCLAASFPSHAQPLFAHTESIESIVVNADLVFIAKLEKFGPTQPGEGREVHDVTLAIEDTLKIDLFTTEPYTRLGVHVARPASVLADWAKRSCRLLVALQDESPIATAAIELSEGGMEVMTADMTLLRHPEAVIRAAREAAHRGPAAVKRIHTFRLKVPREIVAGTRWEEAYKTGGHLRLSVPADQHLEKRAHVYLRSESLERRAEGLRALRYFRSDANITRAKRLLKDPGRIYRHQDPSGKETEAFYLVRYEAYETLKSWRLPVAKPVLREDVRK